MAASTYTPQLARPNLNVFGPGGAWDSSAAASPLNSLGYRMTILYVVLLVGRVPEITAAFLGTALYQIVVVTLMLLALSIITGSLFKAVSNRIGKMWLGFHLWIVLTLPFSGWKRGSLDSLTGLITLAPAIVFLGGFFIQSRDRLRRGLWAVAWAGVIGFAWILSTGTSGDDERFASVGTFGNANYVAIYLLIMTPLWAFIARNGRYRWFTRIAFGAIIIGALFATVRTGSRSGTLTLGLLFLMVFFSASIVDRFKLVVLGFAVSVAVLAWMPDTMKQRVGTIFGGRAMNDVALSAVGSTESRLALLEESIDATIKHPLVGVGIGVYSAVNAGEKHNTGEQVRWQVSHNMYTQVSSETGIPGFLLYMTALFLSIKEVWKIRRAARDRPELRELGMIASSVLASLLVFCFNGLFTSMASDFMAYVLAGLALATVLVSQEASRRTTEPAEISATPPIRSPRFFPAASPEARPAAALADPAPVDQASGEPWRRNPRKYPPKTR